MSERFDESRDGVLIETSCGARLANESTDEKRLREIFKPLEEFQPNQWRRVEAL